MKSANNKVIYKNIGLFFGSFNPIHMGHLILAQYILDFTDLNQIWFVISPQSPFKEKKTLADEHHRLNMVKLAIDDNPLFKACDIEFKLPQPSYTINTLVYLEEKYTNKKFSLIMGADNLPGFTKWKNYAQILERCEIYMYPRQQAQDCELYQHARIKKVNAPLIEISSSFIRNAIKEKKNVQYMLIPQVRQYIHEMFLYEK